VTEKFKVIFLEEADDFLNGLDPKSKEKIIYNIRKAQVINNNELLKKLNGETWEFRTLHNKSYYRLFAFWDKTEKNPSVVVSTHGLVKKTDKIPQEDLDKADRIRKIYYEQKTKKK